MYIVQHVLAICKHFHLSKTKNFIKSKFELGQRVFLSHVSTNFYLNFESILSKVFKDNSKKKINYIKHIFQSIVDVVQIEIFKGLSRHSEWFFFIHCEYFKTELMLLTKKIMIF